MKPFDSLLPAMQKRCSVSLSWLSIRQFILLCIKGELCASVDMIEKNQLNRFIVLGGKSFCQGFIYSTYLLLIFNRLK